MKAEADRFAELLEEHQSRLFAYIYALVQNLADTEDLFQQTSAALWRKFGKLKAETAETCFLAWARETARLEVLHFLRNRRRSHVQFDEGLIAALAESQAQLESDRARTKCINGPSPIAWGVLPLSMTLHGAVARAQSLYFSGTAATVWIDDNATRGWSSVSGGPYTSPWSDGSNAYFEGVSGTVNVPGLIQSVNSLNFNVDGYTLSGGTINLTGPGAIATGPAGDVIGIALTGSVGLSVPGSGPLTLTAANTFTGPTVINGGTLQLGTGVGGQDGSIAGTSGVTNNLALVYNIAGSQTVGYVISGSGGLTTSGSGVLTLAAANTYGGTTVINGGTLKMGTAGLPTNFNAFGTSVNGYQDYFNTATLNSAWVSNVAGVFTLQTSGGLTPSSGYLSVSGPGGGGYGDHLLYQPAGLSASGNMEVLALVQLNSITSGQDTARAGIAVGVNASNSEGDNEFFHGSDSTIDTLNDATAWGASIPGGYSLGTKYWMEMTLTNGTNYTVKLWPANGTTPESAAGTASGTFGSRSGFAGIAGPVGSALNMRETLGIAAWHYPLPAAAR